MHYDVIIIGAGIVGAATAWQITQQYPGKKVLMLEKEPQPALHQTGRNSGVIHAGVYYPPDSLKARYCREGLQQTISFCQQYQIPYLQCGKLLVACNEVEHQRMEALFKRCEQNLLTPVYLDAQQLQHKEPVIAGSGAIWIKQTGIVDYQQVTQRMIDIAQHNGCEIRYQHSVTAINEQPEQVVVCCAEKQFYASTLVVCGGLMADRLITLSGLEPDFRIIPFRGEYYQLADKYNQLIEHLIYPIPDPALPFLGVHLTRMINGTVTLGPNAVLAWQREGYNKGDFNLSDTLSMLGFSGFWPLVGRHAKSGLQELKNSLFKSQYLKLAQKYCPSLSLDDLRPYPSGVRAQAVSRRGELLHDFEFIQTRRCLHVGNAPSPAATSSIPIAKAIVAKIEDKL
ncbi:L-2-hydroxyglutarate oxidase [Neptunicella sp. SCSIO 80796]|uniref:L-2-hydroxyglutarate oxidase n=1 Tax=Neptunicella plasticusilytica TaxID=3117012 RepID=UPI003A4DCD6C